MNERQESIEIDLRQLLKTLWHRAWLILLCGAVVGVAAFGYARFCIAPTYSASTRLYVNNTYGANTVGFSSSQITAAQELADTYMVILESRDVLRSVAQAAELPYTAGQLKSMITAAAVNETEVFQVTVTCTDPEHAARIADAIADVLPETITSIVDGSSVRVLERPEVNANPVGPDYSSYLAVGAVAGMLLCAVVIIVSDLLDGTITDEDYLAQKYGYLPLLAVIPGAQNPKGGSYRGYYESGQPRKKNGGTK